MLPTVWGWPDATDLSRIQLRCFQEWWPDAAYASVMERIIQNGGQSTLYKLPAQQEID